MKTLGQGSLASIIKVVLDIVWYIAWALLAIAALVILAAGATLVMDFLGYSPGPVSELLQMIRNNGWIFPILVAEIIAVMIVIDRLRRIFSTLIAGDPFVPENAGHLRVIALAIAGFQILRHLTQGAVAMLLTILGQPVIGGQELTASWNVDLGAWFAVAALLVLAEVFREGAKMRQEQKLTI
ncbi:MAG: hypothetical protein CMF75_03565 [Maricaulis sp.]|nr:hypothetical protein [Maricaulis sp.]|tara:strand:+ start:638 stop:1186 length:549 start_codon:yes stop_codon:yes gene_type:complete